MRKNPITAIHEQAKREIRQFAQGPDRTANVQANDDGAEQAGEVGTGGTIYIFSLTDFSLIGDGWVPT